MDKVRFGVIGIGNMGSMHVKYLSAGEIEGACLTAVCDINPDRLQWAKNTIGEEGYTFFEDYKKMLDSGLVDAVIIATPHYEHPIMAIEAFKKGINVLSEKPIGVYTKKVEEMYAEARKSGKLFGIMYNQRTNPRYQKLRELVQSGELGELKRCVWIITNWYRTQAYYNSGGWRATWKGEGGGVLINQCPHNLDLWQWIFGMPNKIRGFCSEGKYHNIEVEDDVTAYAEYANGATGVFITTTGEFPGTNRLEISGDRGKLVMEDGKITYTKLKSSEREFCFTSSKGFAGPEYETIELDIKEQEGVLYEHKGITLNFTRALLYGEPLLAPGYDGINGLSISNAIHLSSWTGSTVSLPIDGDLYYQKLTEKIKNSSGEKIVKEMNADLSGTYGN